MILNGGGSLGKLAGPATDANGHDAEELTMAKFHWEGTTRAGEKRRGVMEAETRARSSRSGCASDGLTVEHASRRRAGSATSTSRSAPASRRRISQIFTRQFATMIDAGLPLVQCLDILASQTREQVVQKVLLERQEHRRAGRDVLRRAQASTRRSSTSSTSTSSPPARSAASSTRS